MGVAPWKKAEFEAQIAAAQQAQRDKEIVNAFSMSADAMKKTAEQVLVTQEQNKFLNQKLDALYKGVAEQNLIGQNTASKLTSENAALREQIVSAQGSKGIPTPILFGAIGLISFYLYKKGLIKI